VLTYDWTKNGGQVSTLPRIFFWLLVGTLTSTGGDKPTLRNFPSSCEREDDEDMHALRHRPTRWHFLTKSRTADVSPSQILLPAAATTTRTASFDSLPKRLGSCFVFQSLNARNL